MSTKNVTVRAQLTHIKTFKYDTSDIELTGVGEGLNAAFSDTEFVLSASGKTENLEKLNAGSFRLSADAAGLGEGNHVVDVRVSTADGSGTGADVKLEPPQVIIKISPEDAADGGDGDNAPDNGGEPDENGSDADENDNENESGSEDQ